MVQLYSMLIHSERSSEDLLKIFARILQHPQRSLSKIFQDCWRHIFRKKKSAICHISKLCMCAAVRIYFNRDLNVLQYPSYVIYLIDRWTYRQRTTRFTIFLEGNKVQELRGFHRCLTLTTSSQVKRNSTQTSYNEAGTKVGLDQLRSLTSDQRKKKIRPWEITLALISS